MDYFFIHSIIHFIFLAFTPGSSHGARNLLIVQLTKIKAKVKMSIVRCLNLEKPSGKEELSINYFYGFSIAYSLIDASTLLDDGKPKCLSRSEYYFLTLLLSLLLAMARKYTVFGYPEITLLRYCFVCKFVTG